MAQRQAKEALAMLLIGDGVLGMLRPSAHCDIWRTGHAGWDRVVAWFSDRPALVRVVAGAEVAAGVWLAERQFAGLADVSSAVQATSAQRLIGADRDTPVPERVSLGAWGPVL